MPLLRHWKKTDVWEHLTWKVTKRSQCNSMLFDNQSIQLVKLKEHFKLGKCSKWTGHSQNWTWNVCLKCSSKGINEITIIHWFLDNQIEGTRGRPLMDALRVNSTLRVLNFSREVQFSWMYEKQYHIWWADNSVSDKSGFNINDDICGMLTVNRGLTDLNLSCLWKQ